LRPPIEVADIFRAHLKQYQQQHPMSLVQQKAAHAIINCRTAALGGHVRVCQTCGLEEISYNSCRNRHCPKCLWSAKEQWMNDRMSELLPVPYFHIVFTLPEGLNALVMSNQARLYGLLFRAAWETLHQLALEQKWLGATPGMIAVLHTWGQQLAFHPHLHCIVPGGGLHPQTQEWVGSRAGFFIPVRVLSAVFRGKFMHQLSLMHQRGELEFHGHAAALTDEKAFRRWKISLYQTPWVVYAKRPFGGPQQVVQYLGRYTHRIAISNQRLTAFQNGRVTFTYKDYKADNAQKEMTLDAAEFIRRFLMHILPEGFQKIRYYGFLSSRYRKTKLLRLQKALDFAPPQPEPWAEKFAAVMGRRPGTCPCCGDAAPPMMVTTVMAPQLTMRRNGNPYPLPRAPPQQPATTCPNIPKF
jgi:Putative transposase/Transposase zinc-binding domain